MYYTIIDSPIDPLLLTGDENHLTGIYLDGKRRLQEAEEPGTENAAVFQAAIRQLQAYFDGQLQEFDLDLKPTGSTFQQAVWNALRSIPYGHTETYKTVAQSIGAPKAVRAVGLANGRNPLPIVVPCHRVIGANGKLTGYSGGLDRKLWLLEHEARQRQLFA